MSQHRINVSLDPSDLEIIQIISKKTKTSLSSVIRNIVSKNLEEYEDLKLMEKVEKREKQQNKLISHKEYWKD